MSSEIYIHEDDHINLYFEIKTKGVWLYAHEEMNDEEGFPNGASIHSKRLTIQDLDNIINACTSMRDHMIDVGYDNE